MKRDIFISDVHAGLPGSRSGALKAALASFWGQFDRIVLVGDFLHHWGKYSPDDYALFLLLTQYARDGIELVAIPGNHDPHMRNRELSFLRYAQIVDELEVMWGDKRLLITHGHRFDPSLNRTTWIAFLDWWELRLRRYDKKHRVLQYIKETSSKWKRVCKEFSERAAAEARGRGFYGIVCGHVHQADFRFIDGVMVGNVGCWVDRDPSWGFLSKRGFEIHRFDIQGHLIAKQLQPIIARA